MNSGNSWSAQTIMGHDQLLLQKEPYTASSNHGYQSRTVLLGECRRETNISIRFEEEE